MITIDSLTVRYGPQTVLDNLTALLAERAVHGLVGGSGAGKTTLLDAVYGSVVPESGSITRSGRPLRRRDIAYLGNGKFFYDGMTGRDLLDLTARYNPSSDPAPYIRAFGLPADRPVAEWPCALKKTLALSVALMQRKPLLLLDEPLDGLDPERLHAAREFILRHRDAGGTVLLSSQRSETLVPLCDDILILDGGRIASVYRREEYSLAADPEEAFSGYSVRLSEKPC